MNMSIRRVVEIAFAIIVLLTSCSKDHDEPEVLKEDSSTVTLYKAPANSKFQVVGYIPYYRDITTIPDSKLKMFDVVCYAFAEINASLLPEVQQLAKLQSLVARCKTLGVKVLLSFNGTHAYYASMTSQKASRDRFVDALETIVKQYNLDGLDNDWEYPKTTDGTSTGNALLMKQLSDFCHKDNKYLLTMAITSGKYVGSTSNGILTDVFDDVDWFNVMIYDDYSETLPYINHSSFQFFQTSYAYWVTTRKMPASKFVTGLPLYGRPSGVAMSGNVLGYNLILSQGANAALDSATVTTTAHPSPFTIYYNGTATIRKKTSYSKTHGLGGVMFWEATMDTNDDRSLVRAVNDEIGRTY
jgi:GH18 family chitinase